MGSAVLRCRSIWRSRTVGRRGSPRYRRSGRRRRWRWVVRRARCPAPQCGERRSLGWTTARSLRSHHRRAGHSRSARSAADRGPLTTIPCAAASDVFIAQDRTVGCRLPDCRHEVGRSREHPTETISWAHSSTSRKAAMQPANKVAPPNRTALWTWRETSRRSDARTPDISWITAVGSGTTGPDRSRTPRRDGHGRRPDRSAPRSSPRFCASFSVRRHARHGDVELCVEGRRDCSIRRSATGCRAASYRTT